MVIQMTGIVPPAVAVVSEVNFFVELLNVIPRMQSWSFLNLVIPQHTKPLEPYS